MHRSIYLNDESNRTKGEGFIFVTSFYKRFKDSSISTNILHLQALRLFHAEISHIVLKGCKYMDPQRDVTTAAENIRKYLSVIENHVFT